MSGVQTRKMVEVERGLFLVRYVSAEDSVSPPTIRVSQGESSGQDVRFILHPDADDAVLRTPGSCLVMQAEAQGELAIDIAPGRRRGSVAAKVTIEALNTDVVAPRRGQARRAGELVLTGHVAGRGDVTVKAGEWLAGPTMPARIEGLRFDWSGAPDDLAIRYAAKTARPLAGSSEFVDLGTFSGTRGKALPLVALTLELCGGAAVDRRLSAEMIFLGAPILRVSGQRVSGTGPTGREPLVGLRVALADHTSDHPRRSPRARRRARRRSGSASSAPMNPGRA